MSVNKKIITALILTFALLLSLSACGNSSNKNAKGDESTTTAPSSTVSESTAEETSSEAQQTETSEPIVTALPTTIATEPEETTEPTEPEPPQPTSSVPYITNIAGSVGIYQRPDWNSGFVQYVGASGLYTIVEEAYDSQGNLWGKLKSGAGWVILSEGKQQADQSPQVTAQYADQSILNSGNYHHCIADSTEYAVSVVFRTNISLTNVSLFYVNDVFSFTPGPEAFHIDYWDPGMPFVAEISFPGDMSTFGLRFTDSTGITYTYALSTSGLDGSLKFYKVS